MKAIILDFDGVIHDTFEFHRNKIAEFCGVLLSVQEFKDLHNGNFFHTVPDGIKDVNWEDYRDFIYSEQSSLKIDDDIRDVIFRLNNTYQLFIVSSGGERNITDYMQNNQMSGIFHEILGLEHHHSKVEKFNYIFEKYNLRNCDSVFVTDTLGDLMEANKVNLKTIAIDSGFQERKTLEKGTPYKVISKLDDIYGLLQEYNI